MITGKEPGAEEAPVSQQEQLTGKSRDLLNLDLKNHHKAANLALLCLPKGALETCEALHSQCN